MINLFVFPHKIKKKIFKKNNFFLDLYGFYKFKNENKEYIKIDNLKFEKNSLLKRNPPKVFICGHSHICKVQMDKRLNTLYINPGAAGIKGFHVIRTMMRFSLEAGVIKDMEVIELGKRA